MRYARPFCAILLLALAQSSSYFGQNPSAISPDIVISQVYGGGGNGTGTNAAPFTHDFIELFNRGLTPVSVNGWSLQYGSSGAGGANLGSAADLITPLSGTILPGQYLLVQEVQGANTQVSPLPTPDVTDPSPIAMAAGAGKVALVNTTTPLGCNGANNPCSAAALATIVDLVGYGATTFFEGAAPTPAPGNTIAAFRLGGGAIDTDQNRLDFVLNPPNPRNSGGSSTPTLSINDVSIPEGDTVDPIATFTITLTSPAITPVTVSAATQDINATAGLDYIQVLPTPVTIGIGEHTAMVDVRIIADTAIENTETFEVVLSNPVGATIDDGRGIGTIVNDELPFFAIHDLQGDGAASPHTGVSVATSGVVTALKTNGLFIQTPEAEVDALPETSEGVFVFTGSRPTVAVGDAVRVTGTVQEFRRPSDLLPGTLTEIAGTVGVTVQSQGNRLPAAIEAASFDRTAANRTAQFERYESMLVHAGDMTVVGPANRFGEFHAVLSGAPRPFREPGIDVSDVLPAGAPPTVPRFDGNFEIVMLDSDDLIDERTNNPRSALNVAVAAGIAGVEGPLDYAFDDYRIALTAAATASGTRVPSGVPARTAAEFTIGHANLENYRNVTAARQHKAARIIIEILHTPDILGLIEIGDLEDAQKLADEVNAIASTRYTAYLRDNDGNVTGSEQNIGYLVNADRVDVLSEQQEFFGKMWQIAGETDPLHDRPPYVLKARVRHTGTELTVILNHLKSLIEINSLEPFGDGSVTVGQRNREKRRRQAEDVANLIAGHVDENLVVLGDMNAFEMSDGYVDVLGTLAGSPAAAGLVTNPSVDLWSYELTNLVSTLPAHERYSYVFGGTAQVLDHVLVNQRMLARLTGFAYTRNNADFPESFENDFTVTTRISDHDAPVASFRAVADLTTSTDLPALVTAGSAFSSNVTVTNTGLDRANAVVVTTTIPAGATFSAATAPAGWTCTAAATQLSCTAASLDAGASATIVMHASAQCDLANGSALAASTTASSPDDATTGNNASTDATAISNPTPVISNVSVDTPVLFPPNHKMRDVRVSYSTTDNCGAPNTVLSVSSNEPVTGAGDADIGPDWEVVDANSVRLRAERAGDGTGRIYTVTITATDSAGNASTQSVAVTVPHNQ